LLPVRIYLQYSFSTRCKFCSQITTGTNFFDIAYIFLWTLMVGWDNSRGWFIYLENLKRFVMKCFVWIEKLKNI